MKVTDLEIRELYHRFFARKEKDAPRCRCGHPESLHYKGQCRGIKPALPECDCRAFTPREAEIGD